MPVVALPAVLLAAAAIVMPVVLVVAAVTAASGATPCGRGQRLLVIDDEPELVALAEETLRGLGYVLEAQP